jgi:hypothetical protein
MGERGSFFEDAGMSIFLKTDQQKEGLQDGI